MIVETSCREVVLDTTYFNLFHVRRYREGISYIYFNACIYAESRRRKQLERNAGPIVSRRCI